MWIARNKDNELILFHNKPFRWKEEWIDEEYKSFGNGISEYIFNDLKWEDEPFEVKIVSKNNINMPTEEEILQQCKEEWIAAGGVIGDEDDFKNIVMTAYSVVKDKIMK